MVAHVLIPALRRLRQEGCYELEASLGYIASTRLDSQSYIAKKTKQDKTNSKMMTRNY